MIKWGLLQGYNQKYHFKNKSIHHINRLKKKNHAVSICWEQLGKGYMGSL